jgi:hypothetical protein
VTEKSKKRKAAFYLFIYLFSLFTICDIFNCAVSNSRLYSVRWSLVEKTGPQLRDISQLTLLIEYQGKFCYLEGEFHCTVCPGRMCASSEYAILPVLCWRVPVYTV